MVQVEGLRVYSKAEPISRPGVFSLRVAGVAEKLLLVQCDVHTLLVGACGLLTLDFLLKL